MANLTHISPTGYIMYTSHCHFNVSFAITFIFSLNFLNNCPSFVQSPTGTKINKLSN